ncbi:MAG: ATP-binding protein, partial [Ferruginibacter sp.]
IGDHWNAITILALSQNNPLKAVAELVENSIDAKAKNVTITRGKDNGIHYLRIKDDGEGIRRDADGLPDFHHVATHICDSIKRQMKQEGVQGIQGEFGIGLLSFWTVGEELTITSAGADGKTHQMQMRKGDSSYHLTQKRTLIADTGTEIKIAHRFIKRIQQF